MKDIELKMEMKMELLTPVELTEIFLQRPNRITAHMPPPEPTVFGKISGALSKLFSSSQKPQATIPTRSYLDAAKELKALGMDNEGIELSTNFMMHLTEELLQGCIMMATIKSQKPFVASNVQFGPQFPLGVKMGSASADANFLADLYGYLDQAAYDAAIETYSNAKNVPASVFIVARRPGKIIDMPTIEP